jgi:hypothetical protein
MLHRVLAVMVLWPLLLSQMGGAATAENAVGYRLLSVDEAARLPRRGGTLGLEVERSEQISDSGMTFDLMRVKTVRPKSPAYQARFKVGDQVIAVDGQVFPTIAAFASYVGAVAPGSRIDVDYIPAGGDPAAAQRVKVMIGQPGSTGMSTGEKVAIGAAAAALLCYKLDCFSHRGSPQPPTAQAQMPRQPLR